MAILLIPCIWAAHLYLMNRQEKVKIDINTCWRNFHQSLGSRNIKYDVNKVIIMHDVILFSNTGVSMINQDKQGDT
eukprot:scaffold92183_cov77-Cyclotella_meneghiniana.AAC.1